MIKGITKRWIYNIFFITTVFVMILIISLSAAVKQFYYSSIEQALNNRSGTLVNIAGINSNYLNFMSFATEYIENFPDKEYMEAKLLDREGMPIITSTGFAPDKSSVNDDYKTAVLSKEKNFKSLEVTPAGEKVMSVTRIVYDSKNFPLGAIKYTVSLEPVNKRIMILIFTFCWIGLLVLFIFIMTGVYFIKSIIIPVRQISVTANKIAQGNFNIKIEKQHDDEIGDLCDAINNMAGELGASDKLKNDFISSVSHELRTPLTAIKGWSETMQAVDEKDRETMKMGMTVIMNETERLTNIVEELLDFSRIQSGRMVLMMDKIDILAELDEAIYMLKERASSERKHLIFDEPDVISPVMGDKNRLKQVFINVIDNALKYTSADAIINIQVEDTGTDILIIISDNGCGISSEDLPKVKEKFYKANNTQRGSGIGLALVDEIVSLHNGKLDIESTEGIGTTVTISIPVFSKNDKEEENIEKR